MKNLIFASLSAILLIGCQQNTSHIQKTETTSHLSQSLTGKKTNQKHKFCGDKSPKRISELPPQNVSKVAIVRNPSYPGKMKTQLKINFRNKYKGKIRRTYWKPITQKQLSDLRAQQSAYLKRYKELSTQYKDQPELLERMRRSIKSQIIPR